MKRLHPTGRTLQSFLVCCFLIGFVGACHSKAPQALVARVNSEPVPKAWLEAERKRFAFAAAAKTAQAPSEKELLDQCIDRIILLQEASKLDLKPSQEEMDHMEADARGEASPEEFEKALAKQGLSLGDWRESLVEQWRISKLVEREVLSKLKVSDQEIKDYYWEHLGDFRQSEKRHLLQIFTLKRAEAERAQQEIFLGDDFGQVAQKHSAGPEASGGGDMGWVGFKDLPEALAKVAFSLKPGKTSDIIHSNYGYHLLRVEAVQPNRAISLAEAEGRIRDSILEKKGQLPYQLWLFNLRKNAKIEFFNDF